MTLPHSSALCFIFVNARSYDIFVLPLVHDRKVSFTVFLYGSLASAQVKVKRNNAIAVWAHPIHNKNKFNELDIIEMGIDGIEGFYPDNTNEDTMHYRELSNKYNLLFTAGSDFHDHVTHSEIGTCYIEDEDINKLFNKLDIDTK
jgi:hypothetical protein